MTRRRFRLPVALLAIGALLLGACGRDDDDDAGGATGTTASDGTAKTPADAPGFDGTTIKVGIVTPQTGAVAVIGTPLTNGNKVFFEYVNQELGGVAGKYRIEPVIVDSKYDTTTGVQQYNAIKDDVVLFAQILGTPIVNAALEQLERDNIAASPASLDSFWVREQHLIPIGAPYQIQAINAFDWLMKEGGGEGKTVCTMIQDDPYGEAGQQGVDFAAEELGFAVKTTARFKATDQDFTAQIGQLKDAACQVVFLVSTPTTTGRALGVAAQQGFNPQWIGQSPTWNGALASSPLGPYLQQTFHVAGEGSEWGDTSVPGMAKMIERKDKYAPDQQPDYYFGFGYNQANAVVQILEKAVELGDLSRDGIIEAMNAIEELTFDGLTGDYGYGEPNDREPPRETTIFKVDPAKPFGLATVERDHTSDAAEKFQFEAAE